MFFRMFAVRVEFNYQDYSVKHKFYDTKSHDLPSDIKFYSQWNLDKLEGFLFPYIKKQNCIWGEKLTTENTLIV